MSRLITYFLRLRDNCVPSKSDNVKLMKRLAEDYGKFDSSEHSGIIANGAIHEPQGETVVRHRRFAIRVK